MKEGEVEQKLLVVGSGSFLARHFFRLSRFAKRGTVLAVGRHSPDLDHVEGIQLPLGDLARLKQIVEDFKPTHVVNFAGTTRGAIDSMVQVNLTISAALLAAMGSHSSSCRTVLMGSAAEYGLPREDWVTEEHPLNPVSLYGLTKKWQTELAALSRKQGANVVVARVFNLLGPGLGDHLAFGSFVSQIQSMEKKGSGALRVGNLDVYRDFLTVSDAVSGLDAMLEHDLAHEVYHLASGRAENLSELLNGLIEYCGVDVSVEIDSSRFRENDVERIAGSYERLGTETGWEPKQSPLEALRAMWDARNQKT